MAEFDFGEFFNRTITPLAQSVASKYTNEFLYGETTANELAQQEARNRFNALNGSGAVNPSLSYQSPFGLSDFLFRKVKDPTTGAVTQSINYLPFVLGGFGILLLILLIRR